MESSDYHDYVIKNGQFVGKFEEMYQHVDDPWHHSDASAIQYDTILFLIERYRICQQGGNILDIGCGKGAFTARIQRALPRASIFAVDIAPTAIEKARVQYSALGVNFQIMDILKEYREIKNTFDLIITSQIMWYILPHFYKIMRHLMEATLRKGGSFIINQSFCKPEEQQYGKEFVSTPEDMIRLIGYTPLVMFEINRLATHNVVAIFQPERSHP